MAYQVSARKWRPQTFDDVIGQRHIAQTLTNAIRQKRVAQAYLFSGMRGVGKTTMARILAKALNCLSSSDGPTPTPCNTCTACNEITQGISVDVVEIDGASNTSVDDVRSLRETIKYLPAQGRYKIYIIDEVHMLSTSAFNALLKTLEEPPPHVVFIFATTEANKIPSTIQSRCQHFNFTRIKRKEMIQRLAFITQAEGITVSERGLATIAKASEGSLRDALSLLDQAAAYAGTTIQEKDLRLILGIVDQDLLIQLTEAILQHDAARVLDQVKRLYDQGYDPKQFFSEMVEQVRNLLVYKLAKTPQELIDLPDEELEDLRKLADLAAWEPLQQLFSLLIKAQDEIRGSPHPHFSLEMILVRASRLDLLQPLQDILARLADLQSTQSAPQAPAGAYRDIPPPGGVSKEKRSSKLSTGDQDSSQETQKSTNVPLPSSTEDSPMLSAETLKSWEEAVHRIKETRPNLGSYLEQGTVIAATQEKITLGYPAHAGFLTDLLSKSESRQFINDVLTNVFLKPPKLEIQAGAVKTLAVKPDLSKERQIIKPSLQNPSDIASQENTTAHPLVQEVLQVFGGQVIELNKGETNL